MSTGEVNRALVESGDVDELLRQIDRWCAAREWDALVDLELRATRAVERGKQLFGAAAHAQYRLALEAPAEFAAAAVVRTTNRFAPGPLAEVAASMHTWATLAPHLPPGTARSLVAYERAACGEDIRADAASIDALFDVPLGPMSFEPVYTPAVYGPYGVETPPPAIPPLKAHTLTADPPAKLSHPGARALADLVAHWARDSNGRAEAVAVHGNATDAIAALHPQRVRLAALDTSTALAHLVWAAASGGAHGRRRGNATGRSDTWWALSELAEIDPETEPDAATADPNGLGSNTADPNGLGSALAEALAEQQWFAWDAWEPAGGWRLQLAVEDHGTGLAFAVVAVDLA